MKKVISVFFSILLFMILFLNILSLFNRSFFGFRIYKIATGSMEPFLKINDVIIIKTNYNYKVNDVVTYKKNNEYITHRIVVINGNEIITKGDANNVNDSPITKKDIIGKLIYKFTILKFINYLFEKPFTWILLFIIGIIITCLIPDKKKR